MTVPEGVVVGTRKKYVDAFERITGGKWVDVDDDVDDEEKEEKK